MTLIRSVDCTAVMHAIDRAVLRIAGMADASDSYVRNIATRELENIFAAKAAYDAAAARSSAETKTERDAQEQFLTATSISTALASPPDEQAPAQDFAEP